jgi:hypothetical protein
MQSHTILGSKSQRGLTQLALDVLFQSISHNIVHPTCANSVFPSLSSSDVSEAQMMSAAFFLDSVYGDGSSTRGSVSRAQTPMPVGIDISSPIQWASLVTPVKSSGFYPDLAGVLSRLNPTNLSLIKPTFSSVKKSAINTFKDTSYLSIPATSSKNKAPRPSHMAQSPSVDGFHLQVDPASEYALVVSMYQVYNDRIFDLLVPQATGGKPGSFKPRALLFKSTQRSGDMKVVAGLRKVVCCSLDEALMVLESGRLARKVAETGSNATSSRSHCFFCVEVKKRNRIDKGRWESTSLTIVDLAGEYNSIHRT